MARGRIWMVKCIVSLDVKITWTITYDLNDKTHNRGKARLGK
jgi:hypothetical protein